MCVNNHAQIFVALEDNLFGKSEFQIYNFMIHSECVTFFLIQINVLKPHVS